MGPSRLRRHRRARAAQRGAHLLLARTTLERLSGAPVARRRASAGMTTMTRRQWRVVLLRHGRTEWNATGRFQGQMDAPLDGIGRAQAEAAAVAVAPMRPNAIVTSDLSRAADTAAAVAAEAGAGPVIDPRLRRGS